MTELKIDQTNNIKVLRIRKEDMLKKKTMNNILLGCGAHYYAEILHFSSMYIDISYEENAPINIYPKNRTIIARGLNPKAFAQELHKILNCLSDSNDKERVVEHIVCFKYRDETIDQAAKIMKYPKEKLLKDVGVAHKGVMSMIEYEVKSIINKNIKFT